MVGLFGDGLVSDVLFCGNDSFEEDLRWGPRVGVFVDLVIFDDEANDGMALLKIVEALRGHFLLLNQCGAKDKGREGRGSWS